MRLELVFQSLPPGVSKTSVLLFFGFFLDQRGPSIQSDFDKRVAIFDPKNILDKRPRINVWNRRTSPLNVKK